MNDVKLIIQGLLKSLYPKCQKCNECATKMVTYALLLGGEQYFCDLHTHQDLDKRWQGREARYQKLGHAPYVRQAREFLQS